MIAYIFDGSFEGFLTVVFTCYERKRMPEKIFVEGSFQQELDTEYIFVETDYVKSSRVLSKITEKMSREAYEKIYLAYLSKDKDRFVPMFTYIKLGLKMGKNVIHHESVDDVLYVNKLAQNVTGEAHNYLGIIRFLMLENHILYGEFEPENNILEIVSNHFADRFCSEKWVIHDRKRHIASIYDGQRFVIADVPNETQFKEEKTEEHYQKLWVAFYHSIGIEGRKNEKLQKSLLPLKNRKYVTEFKRI